MLVLSRIAVPTSSSNLIKGENDWMMAVAEGSTGAPCLFRLSGDIEGVPDPDPAHGFWLQNGPLTWLSARDSKHIHTYLWSLRWRYMRIPDDAMLYFLY